MNDPVAQFRGWGIMLILIIIGFLWIFHTCDVRHWGSDWFPRLMFMLNPVPSVSIHRHSDWPWFVKAADVICEQPQLQMASVILLCLLN